MMGAFLRLGHSTVFILNKLSKINNKGGFSVRTLTATEIRHKFGEVVEGIKSEPVLVEKSGRPVAVILSYEDFQRFEALEDAWWGEQARKAASKGLLSAEETASWIAERMNETPTE